MYLRLDHKHSSSGQLTMSCLEGKSIKKGTGCRWKHCNVSLWWEAAIVKGCGWHHGAGDALSFTQIMLTRCFLYSHILGAQERDYGVFIHKCGSYISPSLQAQGSSQKSRKNGPMDQKEWSPQPTALAGHDRTLIHMHLQRLHWMHRTCTRLS